MDNIVPNAMSLITEVPYFTADALNNFSQSDISQRDAIKSGIDKSRRILNYMESEYNKLKDKLGDGRLRRAVEGRISLMNIFNEDSLREATKDNYNKIATIAEKYKFVQIKSFYNVIQLGQLYRLAFDAGEIKQAEEIKNYIKKEIDDINNESPIKAIPISDLVRIQVGAGLLAQEHMTLAA